MDREVKNGGEFLFDMPNPKLQPNTTVVGNPQKKQGNHAELAFDLQANQYDMFSSRPCTESLPYDRVLDNCHRLWKIQIKSVNLKRKKSRSNICGFSLQYNVKSSYVGARADGPCHRAFDARDFDLLAVLFIGYSDEIKFFLPSYFHGRSQCWMNPNGNTMDRLVGWEFVRDLK